MESMKLKTSDHGLHTARNLSSMEVNSLNQVALLKTICDDALAVKLICGIQLIFDFILEKL